MCYFRVITLMNYLSQFEKPAVTISEIHSEDDHFPWWTKSRNSTDNFNQRIIDVPIKVFTIWMKRNSDRCIEIIGFRLPNKYFSIERQPVELKFMEVITITMYRLKWVNEWVNKSRMIIQDKAFCWFRLFDASDNSRLWSKFQNTTSVGREESDLIRFAQSSWTVILAVIEWWGAPRRALDRKEEHSNATLLHEILTQSQLWIHSGGDSWKVGHHFTLPQTCLDEFREFFESKAGMST
jgi:hypothetical protein